MTPRSVGILGLGACLPEKIVTNHDIEKIVDTTDEWIRTRTGIVERRVAEKGTATSDLSAKAAIEALGNAGVSAGDLDLIIVATISGDMIFPSTACLVQKKIGANCPAFDIAAACSGFPYALAIAESFVRSGIYKKILVIGAEVITRLINWKDRSTCVLFGDGAGAAIVGEVQNGHGIIGCYLGADGNQADLLKVPGGGSAIPTTVESIQAGLHYVHMEGSEVFKTAVRTMEMAIIEVVTRNGYKISDIDCLIPHQANMRILTAVASRVEIPMEKVFVNVHRYGNMSAAATVVALYEAVKEGKVKKGDLVVLVAFGSGFTWAASLIRW